MRAALILAVLAAVSLAACNKTPSGAPKSQDEVKAAVAQMARPRPGNYRSTIKLTSFEVPGMPAAQAERIKPMFASTAQDREFCLTPEQADKGYREMTDKLAQGHCKYDKFEVAGSTLDAKMSCEVGKGMTSTVAMKGTITAEGSQMQVQVSRDAPGMPGGGVKMVTDVKSERIGECAASAP